MNKKPYRGYLEAEHILLREFYKNGFETNKEAMGPYTRELFKVYTEKTRRGMNSFRVARGPKWSSEEGARELLGWEWAQANGHSRPLRRGQIDGHWHWLGWWDTLVLAFWKWWTPPENNPYVR